MKKIFYEAFRGHEGVASGYVETVDQALTEVSKYDDAVIYGFRKYPNGFGEYRYVVAEKKHGDVYYVRKEAQN